MGKNKSQEDARNSVKKRKKECESKAKVSRNSVKKRKKECKSKAQVAHNSVKKRKKEFKSKVERPLMSLALESLTENVNANIFIDKIKAKVSSTSNSTGPRVKTSYLGQFEQEKERKLTSLLFNDASSLENEADYSSQDTNLTDGFEKDTTGIEHNVDVAEDLSEEIDNQRKPAWTDDDDQHILWKDVMKRAGSKNVPETNVKYQDVLKEKFLGFYGETPQWAQLDDKPKEEELNINMTVGTYLETSKGVGKIPKTILQYEHLRPLNDGNCIQGKCIKAITFEPQKSLVLVAGSSEPNYGGVTLFKFNGELNSKIKSIQFPNMPLVGAQFLRSNLEFIVGSSQFSEIVTCDLKTSTKNKSILDRSHRNTLKSFEMSPDGKYIVFLCPVYVYIFEAENVSFLEKLSLPSEVNASAFHPLLPILYLYTKNGQIFLFDMDSWRCFHSFHDEGSIEGTSVAVSPDGKRLACGSSSGIVNLYDLTTLKDTQYPRPFKVFTSLVTPVTCLAFNATSELLAIASSSVCNAVRLIHGASLSVFSNFPGAQWSSFKVHCITFSPDSKYLTLGTDRGIALLVRLSHY